MPESTGLRSCTPVELSDRILEANRRWAEADFPGPAPVQPSRRLVLVTCMDSRIDVFEVADRIFVLRLGRPAGDFSAEATTEEHVVSAITGIGSEGDKQDGVEQELRAESAESGEEER